MKYACLTIALFWGMFVSNELQAQNAKDGMTAKALNFTEIADQQDPSSETIERYGIYNENNFVHHPEFGRIPFNAPCDNCIEILEKRSEYGRYFLDAADHTIFYSQQSNEPLHQYVNDQWVTIDHRLKPSGNGFISDYPHNAIELAPAEGHVTMHTPAAAFQFNQWQLFGKTGESYIQLGEANWDNYTVGDDGMHISNIFNGIDAELRILRGGVKLNFILHSFAFPNVDELLFVDAVTKPGGGLHLEFIDQPNESIAIGELAVKTGSETIAVIGSAVVYPENPEREEVQPLAYEITDHLLALRISQELLALVVSGRTLIVDPLVTGSNTLAQAAITGSQYNATCDFATSCNHNLTVPAPANATFTDVLTTFDYIAQGACWLEDGATRFTTGGCVSPNQVGFYWFCNLVGGGDCTAENLSLWADLAGCMPAPSCNEQDVQFTLQFFRGCWGTPGCNNTCIGAGSPWTMTIVGQTVEHTAVSGGIQLSASTICAGEEITATATGQNGVPGYTYAWSFNPGGQPVVATGQTATLTFQNAGLQNVYSVITDACGNESISSASVNVSDGPSPVITGDSEYCQGSSTTLTTGNFASYQWSTGANTPSATVTLADSPVTVTVTDAAGCSGTSEPFQVTELPAPTAIATPQEQTICDGTAAVIELNSSAANTTFDWVSNAQDVAGASNGTGSQINQVLTLLTGDEGQVIYTISPSADGCLGAPIEVIVNVGSGIVPVITGESSHCEGESVVLNTGLYALYNWSTGSSEASVTVTAADSPITVTAIDENGCSGTSEPFLIESLPLPVAVAQVNSFEVCSGEANLIELSSALPAVNFNYTSTSVGVTGASNGEADQINDVLIVSGANAGSVTYTITPSTANCTGEPIEVVIDVEPLPTPTIGGNQTYCSGEPAQLSTDAFATYAWSTGSTSQTTPATEVDNPITVTVTTAAGCSATSEAFTVNESENVEFSTTLSICEGESIAIHGVFQSTPGVYEATFESGGCDSTAIVTLEVLPLPQLEITTNSPVACIGESVTLFATGGENYLWSTGAITPAIEVSPTQTSTYSVEGTSLFGCSATAEISITVGNPDASFSFGATEYCITSGDPTPQITGATGGSFSISGSGVINAQNGQVDLLASGTGSFDITYTIPPPCDAQQTSTIVIIDGGIGSTLDGGNLCPNEGPVTLSANGETGLWSGPGIVDEQSGLFDPSIAGPGFFEVSYTSTIGCITNAVEVTVEDELVPLLSYEPEGGCVPATIDFAVLNNADEYAAVQWTFTGGQIALSPEASVTFQQPGLYDISLELTTEAGCIFSTTEVGALNITPQPQPLFSATPQPADIYNTTIEFIDQSGNNAVQWEWQFDSSNSLGSSLDQNPSFTFPPGQPGAYPVTLTVTDVNGCVGDVTRIIVIRDDFNVFVPNAFTPDNDGVNDVFFIRATDLDPTRFTLQIFNRWGEIVFETTDPEQVWDGSVRGGEHYVQNDVYIWRVVAFRQSGFERTELTGSVTVIR